MHESVQAGLLLVSAIGTRRASSSVVKKITVNMHVSPSRTNAGFFDARKLPRSFVRVCTLLEHKICQVTDGTHLRSSPWTQMRFRKASYTVMLKSIR